jgi:hypothetical protein
MRIRTTLAAAAVLSASALLGRLAAAGLFLVRLENPKDKK